LLLVIAAAALVACAWPRPARAITTCELDGQAINTNDGRATAGKSGMLRCRDSDGTLQREQQLQNGVTMGLMRYYRQGVLQQEFNTNERGNRDGRSRTFAATPGSKNPLLREETNRNGTTVGTTRDWYPDGTLARLSFHLDDGRETAVAAFTAQGRLSELRCTSQPVFAPDADDASWCGFRTGMTTVDLFASNGTLKGRITHDHGERRKLDTLWANGRLREQTETSATGGAERNFAEDGVKRKEVVWIIRPGETRAQRVVTLEQEYHESGALVHERRWGPTERGSEPALDQHWYLNGQVRDKTEYLVQEGQAARRETTYHDNGRVSSEGLWLAKGSYRDLQIGAHKRFDVAGNLRSENFYDPRGRLTRERELDETGKVTRDDQVFEDGSRKAYAK
jgi:antitoxin component YwqK of YwqJK toxin-antitoxin module